MVSVVVPNYNYARYLSERLDSVFAQTFQDFEVILIDDASTDNSVEILKRYATRPQVSHLVINEQNTGSPFVQWLKGIRLAQGKYIWIAEADDVAENTFLESCVKAAEAYTDTSLCYCGFKTINETSHINNRDMNHWGRRSRHQWVRFEGRAYAEHNSYWKNYVMNVSGAIFNRQAALELAESPCFKMRYCGDWQLYFELALRGGVVEVYKVLNYFRQHPDKATRKSHTAGEGLREDIEIVRFMEKNLPHLSNYKKELRRGLLYKKIIRQHPQNEREILDELNDKLGGRYGHYITERKNRLLQLFNRHLLTPRRDRI